MRIAWLKGDYVGKNKERQKTAGQKGCQLVISFHFNSSANPKAKGAEVYHNEKGESEVLADALLSSITQVLGVRARGVKKAKGTRASFLQHYPCPAVLLEPCFVTNPKEAAFLHDIKTMRRLGEAIAGTILLVTRPSSPIPSVLGLDIGHKFKTSQPYDKGAKCALGDFEADHAERLAKVVAASLRLKEKEETKGV